MAGRPRALPLVPDVARSHSGCNARSFGTLQDNLPVPLRAVRLQRSSGGRHPERWALFPLRASLRIAGWRPVRVIALSSLLSFGVEAAQFLIRPRIELVRSAVQYARDGQRRRPCPLGLNVVAA